MADTPDPMAAAREVWLEQDRFAGWEEFCGRCMYGEPALPEPRCCVCAASDAFEAGWTAAMAQGGLLQDRAARAAGKGWDYEDDPYE